MNGRRVYKSWPLDLPGVRSSLAALSLYAPDTPLSLSPCSFNADVHPPPSCLLILSLDD